MNVQDNEIEHIKIKKVNLDLFQLLLAYLINFNYHTIKQMDKLNFNILVYQCYAYSFSILNQFVYARL